MFFRVLAAMLTADAIDRHRRAQQQLELLRARQTAHGPGGQPASPVRSSANERTSESAGPPRSR
jgi:hypothetical protein